MEFWTAVVILVLGVSIVQAIQEVAKRRVTSAQELEPIRQDIAHIRKDLEEIKESIADLIIQQDRFN